MIHRARVYIYNNTSLTALARSICLFIATKAQRHKVPQSLSLNPLHPSLSKRSPFSYVAFIHIVFLPLISSAQVFVDHSANGTNDGTSWANAYTDLNLALTNTSNGEIWVADGTYTPTTCTPCDMTDMEMAFNLPPAVQLYGGFSGDETALNQRDWTVNHTILSGDIGVPLDSLDNSYRVVIAENSTTNTVLDGFIIEEGNADGSFGQSAGGGLLIDANPGGTGDIQVRNCTFRNNYAGGGGAIAIDCVLGGTSRALIRDCLFEGNTASLRVVSTGAAIFMQGNSGAIIEPQIINCTFKENFCGNDGGAIAMTPTGEGSLLRTLIDSCLFVQNRATDRGAAIWYRMSSFGISEVMIRNSQFIENTCGGQGGAIFARSSFDNIANDTIMNCLFSLNETDGSSEQNDGEGGAIFLRGSQNGTRNQEIINCVFDRNYAEHRGGAVGTTSIFSDAGTCNASFTNCTFSRNTTQGEGGAIHAEGAEGTHTLTITNSILWQDSAATIGQEIWNNSAIINLSFSDVEGGIPTNVIDAGNNVDLDPMFADSENGDVHLLNCSPLLNIGNNAALSVNVITDLDGNARIHEGTVDPGAYEIGIIYVDLSATGANNGRSWADAFTDFQDALAVAAAGDQIWVAGGTYYPTSCNPCDMVDMEIAFNLVNNVEVYGGFNGSEAQLQQRDWLNNLTIFSGDIGVPFDSLDNSYRVLIADNTSDKTILDGFIIEEGNADGSFGLSTGGGLLINANPGGRGDIQVRNCTFRNNYAGGGGAIAIDCVLGGTSQAVIRDCVFEGNTASLRVVSTGAAIFMQGNSGAQIEPQIINCIFRENFCGNDGGAVSMTPTGEGSLLATLIDSCFFINNRATDRGAAIWYRMNSFGQSQVRIKNSSFSNNTSGGQGGAIFARSSFDNIANDTIINCSFVENIADGSSEQNDGEGGAIFLRGSQDGTRNQEIINCVFDRNSAAQRGGAIGTTSLVSSPGVCNTNIVNCTFSANSTQGEGGAIHTEGVEGLNSMIIINSILWKDTAMIAGNEIFNNGAIVDLSFSDIEGGIPNGVNDQGMNLNVNPQFLDPENGNLRLSACSPAINVGANQAITQALVGTDLDGEPRIFEEVVDLGAYEWNGEPPALNIAIDNTPVSCNDLCDGTATANAAGGIPGYSFEWSNGQTTATASDLCAGTYYVTISDAFNCEKVDSVLIIETVALEISTSADTTICEGETLELSAAGNGGNGNYSFEWDNGLGSGEIQTVMPNLTTVYKVTLTDENNCAVEDTVNVEVIPIPEVTIMGSSTFCPGSSTILDGGSGFTSYTWSDGSMDQTLEVAVAGTYGLTVTDNNGCAGSTEIIVTESEAFETIISGDLAFCQDLSTILDAGQFATYLWTTGDTTRQIMVTEGGEYSVTVSDLSGCTGEGVVSVEALAVPEVSINGSSAFCVGSSTILSSSDSFNTYQWSDGSMDQTLEVAVAGTYGLTVTDNNGCAGSTEIIVTESEALEPIISGALAFCQDSSTILDAGQFATYLWTTGDTTRQIMVTEGGEYSVTVSDLSGCTGEGVVSVEALAVPEVSINGSSAFCVGSSTILSSSDSFNTYQWSDGSMDQTLEVAVAGTYGLTVTDNNGCAGSTEIIVTESEALEPIISGALAFCQDSSTILDAGQFATYLWTTGDTTRQIMVTEGGDYSVTVSDAGGCIGETMVVVEAFSLPDVQITGSTTFCPGGTTILDGGAGYSSYAWSDGSDAQTLEVQSEGLIELTVTDANGCEGISEILVSESVELMPVIAGDLLFCIGEATTLDAGLFATYEWTTGDTTQQILVSESGNFSVTVTDGEGCSGETTIFVEAIPAPIANDDTFTLLADEERSFVFDFVENDVLNGLNNWTIEIVTPPNFGVISNFEEGILTYTAPPIGTGQATIIYQLCSTLCSDLCSTATVTINVTLSSEEEVTPSGITPNGDGLNDTFVFDQINTDDPESIPNNELIIYNRWGDIVYRKKPYDNTWDGTHQNGQALPEATYYYILYLYIGDGLILKGDVTVIR